MANEGRRQVKLLTASDVEDSFEIPAAWFNLLQLPSGRLEERHRRLCVVDWRGFFWELWCTESPERLPGPDGTPRSIPPRFFEGFEWQRFVLRNGLRLHDALVLETQDPDFMEVGLRLSAMRYSQSDHDFNWIV